MTIQINTNIASLNAQKNLFKTQSTLNRSLERLSSGLRINSAKDDAAGLAISDRMTSQIRGLNQAVRNANDGISLAQTGEGALAEASNLLQRIRELAIQSANDTNSASDRNSLQDEVVQLKSELNRIANTTSFNGKVLFDGTFGTASFHVGAEAHQTIGVTITDARATNLGAQRVHIESDQSLGATASAANTGAQFDGTNGLNLTINGPEGSGTTADLTSRMDSAKEFANQVNSLTDQTGVSATANTKIDMTGLTNGNYSFKINGETITATVSGNNDFSEVVEAINEKSAVTGVTAKIKNTTTVVLEESTGGDIKFENLTGEEFTIARYESDGTVDTNTLTVNSAGGTNSFAEVRGVVTLESAKSFNVGTDEIGTNATNSGNSQLSKVSDIDISTVTGSEDAISVIDKALAKIDENRASLGSLQNRFEATIANLQNVSENISAARSRILDADFAAETADLTRAQILQQAGTAMLVQANQLPTQALQLLQ